MHITLQNKDDWIKYKHKDYNAIGYGWPSYVVICTDVSQMHLSASALACPMKADNFAVLQKKECTVCLFIWDKAQLSFANHCEYRAVWLAAIFPRITVPLQ